MEESRRKKRQNGISFGLFFMTILMMSIIISLSIIKIYLSNQIYYESRRINYIQREVSALKEENIMLENQLQRQKFKNCVSDIDFSIESIEKSYDQYIVNKFLSMDNRLIFLAEMLNTMHNLTNAQHFDIIKEALPKEKFKIRYIKKSKDLTLIEKKYIANYFEIGLREAEIYIDSMDDYEISCIIDKYRYGKNDIVKM